jgi:multidrug resistance efflux pump
MNDRSEGSEPASREVADPNRAGEAAARGSDRSSTPETSRSVAGVADSRASPPLAEDIARRSARREVVSRRGLRGGRSDSEFHPGVLAIDEAPRSPIRWRFRLSIAALVIAALTWATFGRLASFTTADGKVQMVGSTKVLQAVAAGKVIRLHAHDGDVVEAGAILVELDPAEAIATRAIVDQNLRELRAETLRLRTEAGAATVDPIDPNAKIPWGGDVPADVRTREEGVAQADLMKLAAQLATLTSQKHAKEAERDRYANNIQAQKALLDVTRENLTMIETLVKVGYNSEAKYLEMKAQLDDQQVKLTGYEGSLADAKQAILTLDSEIAKVRENLSPRPHRRYPTTRKRSSSWHSSSSRRTKPCRT